MTTWFISSDARNSPPECPAMTRIYKKRFWKCRNIEIDFCYFFSRHNQVNKNLRKFWNACRSDGHKDSQWTVKQFLDRPSHDVAPYSKQSSRFCIPQSSFWLYHKQNITSNRFPTLVWFGNSRLSGELFGHYIVTLAFQPLEHLDMIIQYLDLSLMLTVTVFRFRLDQDKI